MQICTIVSCHHMPIRTNETQIYNAGETAHMETFVLGWC